MAEKNKIIRGILDCGCIIYTDASYEPCDFHNQLGYLPEEKINQLCLELAGEVLDKIFKKLTPKNK